MELKDLIFVKETLQELIADPEIDFGPAYEMAKVRKKEALKILRAEIAWEKRQLLLKKPI
jgi:hypothetical protein